MGVTRLKRKDRRNKSRANNRINKIKQLTAKPVIKNVDVEEIKAGFAKSGGSKASAKAEKVETAKESPAKAATEEKASDKKEVAAKATKEEKKEEKASKKEDSKEDKGE